MHLINVLLNEMHGASTAHTHAGTHSINIIIIIIIIVWSECMINKILHKMCTYSCWLYSCAVLAYMDWRGYTNVLGPVLRVHPSPLCIRVHYIWPVPPVHIAAVSMYAGLSTAISMMRHATLYVRAHHERQSEGLVECNRWIQMQTIQRWASISKRSKAECWV